MSKKRASVQPRAVENVSGTLSRAVDIHVGFREISVSLAVKGVPMKTLFSSLQLHNAFCGRYRSSAEMEKMRSQLLVVRAGFTADRQSLARDRKNVAGDFNRAFNKYRSLHEKRN